MNYINTMDWKEEMVLHFRKLTIDKDIISKAMKNFVTVFNKNLDKYEIDDVEATTDLNNYINIKSYKKIKIEYTENNVTFALYKDDIDQDIYIRLSIAKEVGYYLIEYVNADSKKLTNPNEFEPRLIPFITEDIIDEIFKNLFKLNMEKIEIKR